MHHDQFRQRSFEGASDTFAQLPRELDHAAHTLHRRLQLLVALRFVARLWKLAPMHRLPRLSRRGALLASSWWSCVVSEAGAPRCSTF